jgi:hypothetical protein
MRERIPDLNDGALRAQHEGTAPPAYGQSPPRSSAPYPLDEGSVYPQLPPNNFKAITDFSPEHNYKINQIILKHKFLNDETLKRNSLKKKYSKIRKTLTLFEVLLIGGEISITVASVALPVLIPLLPIFGGLTASGVGCRFISSYFSKKEKKHETLAILANSKTRSIEENFAKALRDGVVSDEEYSTIEREVKLYIQYQEAGEKYMSAFGAGASRRGLENEGPPLTDKMKNELIEKGRNEILSTLKNMKDYKRI